MNIHITNLIDILAAADDKAGQYQLMVHKLSSDIKGLDVFPLKHPAS